MAHIGDKMFLIGVMAQGVSYCLFTLLFTVALIRLKNEMGLQREVKVLLSFLFFPSFSIIIRSIYRVIEFAQGYDGYLMSKIYLFVLYAIPLCLAVGVWAIVWPPVLLYKLSGTTQKVCPPYAMEDGYSNTAPNTLCSRD